MLPVPYDDEGWFPFHITILASLKKVLLIISGMYILCIAIPLRNIYNVYIEF
jgi:hypothetical protein